MPKLLAYFIVLGYFACKSKPEPTPVVMNDYTVITQRKGINPVTNKGERQIRETPIEAISDSAAYLEGIKEMLAEMRADTLLRKDKVQYPEFDPHDLVILDATGTSIMDRLSKSIVEYGLNYFERNK
jgi:hypothetical protein